jgi:RNA polymerase sigma factor (sigma-70 family)
MKGLQNSGAQFSQTHWTMVLAARHWNSPEARDALAKLCQTYWYPLYAFTRRRGHSPHEAQDLTQDFFVHLLEHGALEQVDQQKGKFRSFLLAALTNFLNNQWAKENTLKRGGTQMVISLDEILAEERYRQEPANETGPEALFDRGWACTVAGQVMAKLKAEYAASDKGDVYTVLEHCLTGETDPGFYQKAAAKLGKNEGAVKVDLHRLRRRFGELLRNEIANTVSPEEEVDGEVRHLFAAIGA